MSLYLDLFFLLSFFLSIVSHTMLGMYPTYNVANTYIVASFCMYMEGGQS